jgi:DNA-binding GntR family transcriptional regulator
VAQGSIREAINILAQDGFVTKESGRSARVIHFLDNDLRFHLELCEISRHPFVLEHARRILLPFFAFVRMRVTASGQQTSAWHRDLEAHQRIVDLLP